MTNGLCPPSGVEAEFRDVMSSRCPTCDRAECRRRETERAWFAAGGPSGDGAREYIDAMFDCDCHRPDWRSRCLAAESALSEAKREAAEGNAWHRAANEYREQSNAAETARRREMAAKREALNLYVKAVEAAEAAEAELSSLRARASELEATLEHERALRLHAVEDRARLRDALRHCTEHCKPRTCQGLDLDGFNGCPTAPCPVCSVARRALAGDTNKEGADV